jgi:hypothetical protein
MGNHPGSLHRQQGGYRDLAEPRIVRAAQRGDLRSLGRGCGDCRRSTLPMAMIPALLRLYK